MDDENILERAMRLEGQELISTMEDFYARIFSDPEHMPRYYSKSYIQSVNGSKTDYDAMISAIGYMEEVIASVKHSIIEAVARPGIIAERHIVSMTLKDGRKASSEVYCFLKIEGGMIVAIDEASHTLEGNDVIMSLMDVGE